MTDRDRDASRKVRADFKSSEEGKKIIAEAKARQKRLADQYASDDEDYAEIEDDIENAITEALAARVAGQVAVA